jgi:hypothetical protein
MVPAMRRRTAFHRLAAWGCAALGVATVLGPAPAQARTTTTAPPGRQWASFAYYPPLHQLVLFGGNKGSTVYGDTWTRTGSTWAQQHPATSPSPRTGASMVYDPATQQLLLFGGGATVAGSFNGDTWTWNGTTWTQLHPATSPPGREFGDPVYDAATKTVVLFAGWHGSYLDDTWSWNGTTWTPLSPPASPGVDVFAWQGAYDAATGQLLLFGGDRGKTKPALDGTWEWTGTTWNQLSPATSPPGRSYGTMTYNAADQRVVLAAGKMTGTTTTYPATIWSWNGSTWNLRS